MQFDPWSLPRRGPGKHSIHDGGDDWQRQALASAKNRAQGERRQRAAAAAAAGGWSCPRQEKRLARTEALKAAKVVQAAAALDPCDKEMSCIRGLLSQSGPKQAAAQEHKVDLASLWQRNLGDRAAERESRKTQSRIQLVLRA